MARHRYIGLVIFSLLTLGMSGCASATGTPVATETPTETPTDMYQSEILLANNELEEEFLQIALASCAQTQTKSLIVVDSGASASEATYFRPGEDLLNPENSFTDGPLGDRIANRYTEFLPRLFDPCLLEQQAAYADDPNAPLLEHSVVKVSPFRYVWSQHHGGANLESLNYDVTDGLISQYSTDDNQIFTEVGYTEFEGDVANFFIEYYGY